MKYEKLFKAYRLFFYFVPLQAIYLKTSSYTVYKEMYRSLLIFFSKIQLATNGRQCYKDICLQKWI